MDRSSPGMDARPSPEIAAVVQAIDALQQQLLTPPAPAAITPALSTYPAEAPHLAQDAGPRRFEAVFFGGFALQRAGRRIELGQQWSSRELCRYLIAQRGRLVPCEELIEVLWFRAAIVLYRGDFLADHPYAEWTQLPRDHFRERRLTALAILCECAARDHDRAVAREDAKLQEQIDGIAAAASTRLEESKAHAAEQAQGLAALAEDLKAFREGFAARSMSLTKP